MTDRRAQAARVLAGTATLAVLAGCTGSPRAPDPAPPAAAPPAPPAACLLDPATLARDTGLTWTPDQTIASDTRCVYDPGATHRPGAGTEFLSVQIDPTGAADPQSELDSVAAACASRSRTPLRAGSAGFICHFRGGTVFAAVVHGGQLVTVSAAAVPEGTTEARLVLALQQQLDNLGD